MMSLEEIKIAVTQLSCAEFAQFSKWCEELPSNGTDQQPASNSHMVTPENDPILARIRERLKHVLTDPDEIREAEAEFLEFQRNMNANRRAVGGRLPYPDVE